MAYTEAGGAEGDQAFSGRDCQVSDPGGEGGEGELGTDFRGGRNEVGWLAGESVIFASRFGQAASAFQ